MLWTAHAVLAWSASSSLPRDPSKASHASTIRSCLSAALIRESLLLLHAVTNCRGVSFQENPVFWKDALSLELSSAVPITSQRLPRVALDWNPQDVVALSEYDKAMSQRLLKTSVLDLFTTTSPPPFSQEGHGLLVDACQWIPKQHRDLTRIECVVMLRFARTADATKALVHAVISAAKTAAANHADNSLAWIGVQVVSSDHVKYVNLGQISIANLAIVTHLCVALPVALGIDIRLPRSKTPLLREPRAQTRTQSRTLAFVAFLAPAIGVRDTNWLGRLTVLDLMYRFQYYESSVLIVDLAALCSMLPLARSLCKLRVTITSTSDLV